MTESRERSHQHDRWTCAPNRLECVCHILCRSWGKKIVSHSSIILRRLKSQHTAYITCYIRSPRQFNANVCIFTAALTWNLCWFQPQPQFSSHCWVKINLRFFKTVMRMGWEYFTSCSFCCVHFFFAQSRRGISRRVKISVEMKGELKKRRREFSCVQWTCCVSMHFVGIIGRSGKTRISESNNDC